MCQSKLSKHIFSTKYLTVQKYNVFAVIQGSESKSQSTFFFLTLELHVMLVLHGVQVNRSKVHWIQGLIDPSSMDPSFHGSKGR